MSGNSTKITCSSAFTLVELMVTVAIIGILASIALPRYSEMKTRATLTTSKANLSSMAKAAQMFYQDRGFFPPSMTFDSKNDLQPLSRNSQYIDQTSMADPFQRPTPTDSLESDWFTFTWFSYTDDSGLHGYTYINYRNYIPPRIPAVRGIGIYSIGPDRTDSWLSLYPLSDNSETLVRRELISTFGDLALSPVVVYDPSNGLRSRGDFGVFTGEFNGFVPQDAF